MNYPIKVEEFLRKFAIFILKSGVNIQKNQNLLVTADPYHWPFLTILAEEAYKLGARYVEIQANSEALLKARIDYSSSEHLEYVPDARKAFFDSQVDEDWCKIYFDGAAEPDILAGTDKERFSKINRAIGIASEKLRKACMSNRIAWTVAALPTPKWAAKVLGGIPDEERERMLWELLTPIYRLDRDDPAKAWEEHNRNLLLRSRWLNEKKFKRIHLTSHEGTDLEIDMIPGSSWQGGASYTPGGIKFSPNIPSEEIFITPDYRKTNGRAVCTRPVRVMGTQATKVWFEFRDGKVVDFGAEKGEDAIKYFMSIDEGASYLGELALVGCDSPIYQCGKVFESILFDENASCHIALGSGYVDGIDGAEEMNDEDLKRLGCNKSIVHTDFMVGSESMKVIGINEDSLHETIMEKGLFKI